jgi:hypothetical protein
VEQPVACTRGHRRLGRRAAVHEQDVQPAIAVGIEQHAAAAQRFGHVPGRGGAVDVLNTRPTAADTFSNDGRRRRRAARTGLRRGARSPRQQHHPQRREPSPWRTGAEALVAGAGCQRQMPAAVLHRAQRRQQVGQEHCAGRTAAAGHRLFQRVQRVLGAARAPSSTVPSVE